MQQADIDLLDEVGKRFKLQCLAAKGDIEKAMEPFGFPWAPLEEDNPYGFLASIEVHPVRMTHEDAEHHYFQGEDTPPETQTFLVVFGLLPDCTTKFLYKVKATK